MYVPDTNNRKLFDGGRDLTNSVRLTYKSYVIGPQWVTAALKTCNFAWSHQPTHSKIYGIQIKSLSSFFLNKANLCQDCSWLKLWMYISDSMNAMWFDLHKCIKVRFYISLLITKKMLMSVFVMHTMEPCVNKAVGCNHVRRIQIMYKNRYPTQWNAHILQSNLPK